MSDEHEPHRVFPDEPDRPLIDRVWLALGVQPSHVDDLFKSDDARVRLAATFGENARRLQFVTEDWAMERGFREDAETAIREAAARHPDDEQLAAYVTWMDEER